MKQLSNAHPPVTLENLASQLIGVTATFRRVLNAIFGPGYDSTRVHITGFPGDPHVKADTNWYGWRVSDRPEGFPADHNVYVCMGLQTAGSKGRSLATTDEDVALWMDDVGTKVPRDQVEDWIKITGLKPTLVVQTSPGNFSYTWRLSQSVLRDNSADARTITAIRDFMKEHKWGDPGCVDASRFMRVGVGINGKAPYRDPFGQPFKLRIEFIDENQTVDLAAFALGMMGFDWQTIASSEKYTTPAALAGSSNERHASMSDPFVQLATAAGLAPSPSSRAGVIDCLCPNQAAHTHGDPTGYAIINDGMSFCNHSSCQGLRSPDFSDMIEERYEAGVATRVALGLVVVSPLDGKTLVDAHSGARVAPTGRSFMAGVRFAAVPLDAAGVGEDGTGEALAGRITAKVEASAKAHDDALGYWSDRLIYIKQAAAFWDTDTKTLWEANEVDRDREVLVDFPLVSGDKRASTQILNAKKIVHADTLIRRGYRAGTTPTSPIVPMLNASGVAIRAVNTFVPGRIGFRPGTPTRFLDHLAFLFDASTALYLLEFFAWRVQNPGGRTHIIPLIYGEQGVGKDIMLEQVFKLLGDHNVTGITMSELVSGFNEFILSPTVYMGEFSLEGAEGKKAYTRLKGITGSRSLVTINGKYSKKYQTEAQPVFIATTNNENALAYVDSEDRRVFQATSEATKKDDNYYNGPGSFGEFYSDVANLEVLHRYLMDLPLTVFAPNGQPPKSKGRQDALAAGLAPVSRFIYDLMTEGDFADRKLLVWDEIMDAALASPNSQIKHHLSIPNVVSGLKAAGCRKLHRVRRNNVLVNVWSGASVVLGDGTVHRGMNAKDASRLRSLSVGAVQFELDQELLAVQARVQTAQDVFVGILPGGGQKPPQ